MNWQAIFEITNGIALIGWLLLIFAPRRPLVLSATLYLGVGLLCLIYTALLIGLLGGLLDPVRPSATTAAALDDYSVRGLRALFSSEGGVTVGWTHYLALDLFTGLWIARDGDGREVGRLVQAPILLATFLAGPLGLLVWLALRTPLTRRPARTAS